MEAKLSVEIGADVSKLTQGMANAANVVSSGASKIDKSTITLQRNLNNLNKTPFTFGQNFQRQSQIAANGVNQLDNAVKKSRSNMLPWLHTIQDLPFGMMGIQNNLTQLIPGVGAAAFAFSALVSALTFSQVGLTYWNNGAKDAKKETESLTEANKEYVDSLSNINQVQVKGRQDAAKDLISLESLYKATQNTSISVRERTKAVEELQKQYPSYFGNLSNEAILNGQAKTSYDNLTKSITATAIARAAEDKAVDITKQQIINLTKRNELEEQQLKLSNDLANVRGSTERESSLGMSGVDRQRLAIQRQLIPVQGQLLKLSEEDNKLAKDKADLFKIVNDLTTEFGTEIVTGLNGGAEAYERLKVSALDYKKAIDEQNKAFEDSLKTISAYLTEQAGGANLMANTAVVSVPMQFQLLGLEPLSESEINKVIAADLWEEKIEDLGRRIDSSIRNSLGNALSGIAEGLGESLATGANIASNLGNMLLSTMGELAINLGKLAVGTGVAIGGIKKALASLNPATAIAGGLALIALGAAVRGAASNLANSGNSSGGYQIPKFANGVTNFSGGTALVGERGPELVSLPTGSNVITNENIRRYGVGGGSQVFIPNMKIEGQDLVVVFDRASRNRNRIT